MPVQQTLSILKPDATRRNVTGLITARIEESGLRVIAQRRLHLTFAQAEAFYEEHKERPFFASLCATMSEGAIVAQVLEGEDAIVRYRALMGATNPEVAEPGTIRRDFAESIEANTVHGSDGLEAATREIAFFFSQMDIAP